MSRNCFSLPLSAPDPARTFAAHAFEPAILSSFGTWQYDHHHHPFANNNNDVQATCTINLKFCMFHVSISARETGTRVAEKILSTCTRKRVPVETGSYFFIFEFMCLSILGNILRGWWTTESRVMCASRAEPVCISNGRRGWGQGQGMVGGDVLRLSPPPFFAFVTHGFVPFLILRLNKNSPTKRHAINGVLRSSWSFHTRTCAKRGDMESWWIELSISSMSILIFISGSFKVCPWTKVGKVFCLADSRSRVGTFVVFNLGLI